MIPPSKKRGAPSTAKPNNSFIQEAHYTPVYCDSPSQISYSSLKSLEIPSNTMRKKVTQSSSASESATGPKKEIQPPTIKRKRDATHSSDGTNTSSVPPSKKQKKGKVEFPSPLAKDFGRNKKDIRKSAAEDHAQVYANTAKFPCPEAETFSCTQTFNTKKIAKVHLKTHDSHRTRFPCPLAEIKGCDKTFTTKGGAKQHATTFHAKKAKTFKCLLAEKKGYDKTFTTKCGAKQHATLHANRAKTFTCPLAEGKGCDKTFATKGNAKQHATTFHTDKAKTFICPLAEKLGCTLMFNNKSNAKKHAANIHDPIIQAKRAAGQEASLLLPCLSCFKQGLFCDVNNTIGECSNCLEYNQLMTSETSASSRRTCKPRGHTGQKPSLRDELRMLDDGLLALDAEASWNDYIEVPEADKTDQTCLSCDEIFLVSQFEPTKEERSLGHVGRHGVCEACRAFNARHSVQKRKCRACHTPWPLSFFKAFGRLRSIAKADQNADSLLNICSKCRLCATAQKNCTQEICTVPMCRFAVAKALLRSSRMAQHMELHQVRGDLEALETYPHPVKVQAPNSLQDLDSNENLVDIVDDNDLTQEDEMAEGIAWVDSATEYLEEAVATDHKEILQLLQQNEKEEQLSQGMMFSDRYREKTRALNESFINQRPGSDITFFNKGRGCLGPRPISSNGFVKILCPYQAVIALDTAFLQVPRGLTLKPVISLAPRCVSCAEQLRLTRILKKLGLLGDETLEKTQCEYRSCFKLGWRNARYCEEHLICGLPRDKAPQVDAAVLRQSLEGTQWTYGLTFEEVMNRKAKIADGKMPGAMLTCVDIEFSPLSGKVFEVALCECHSGKQLVNARVKHDCSDMELHKAPDGAKQNPAQETISLKSSINVYGIDRRKCTDLLDVHAIAAQFRDCGITPQSIFLSWHKTKNDLTLLRDFFEEAGYDDILPPSNANCIQMVPHFRRNLPAKGVPLYLEAIFPLLFANHELVGQNHRALVDTLQLRLMVLLFVELCKPFNQRDLSMLPETIRDWLIKAKHQRTLSETPVKLNNRKERDKHFLMDQKLLTQPDDDEWTKEDKGVVVAPRAKGNAADIKQKRGLTQLKLVRHGASLVVGGRAFSKVTKA